MKNHHENHHGLLGLSALAFTPKSPRTCRRKYWSGKPPGNGKSHWEEPERLWYHADGWPAFGMVMNWGWLKHSASCFTHMLHGAGIFTYKTGWFLGQMLVNIFHTWSIWVILSDTIFGGRKLGSLKNTMNSSIWKFILVWQMSNNELSPCFFFVALDCSIQHQYQCGKLPTINTINFQFGMK